MGSEVRTACSRAEQQSCICVASQALVSELSSTVQKETFAVNFDLLCLEKVSTSNDPMRLLYDLLCYPCEVVMALSRHGRHGQGVPGYRDCILTWVLREVYPGIGA